MRGAQHYLGRRFGRLTVLDYLPDGRQGYHPKLKCRCTCGAVVEVFTTNVNRGFTRSCGCLNDETRIAANTRHGRAFTSEHHIWTSMIQRCTNVNHQSFKDYGGRGIAVCERWLIFDNFLADMGDRPSRGHSLDRYPNNDGNYEPGNCRWATRQEQNRNRRTNRLVTLRGQTKTIAEWSALTGIGETTLNRRLLHYGYTPEEALTKPLYWRGR